MTIREILDAEHVTLMSETRKKLRVNANGTYVRDREWRKWTNALNATRTLRRMAEEARAAKRAN